MMVTQAVKLALSIVANIVGDKSTLDGMVELQYEFLNEIMSLPTINKYLIPLMFE